MEVKRGQLWYADLGENVGSVQSNKRPVVILQTDKANRNTPTFNVAPLTSSENKKNIRPHYILKVDESNNLQKESTVLLEAITTISIEQLIECKGIVKDKDMTEINYKLARQLGLFD